MGDKEKADDLLKLYCWAGSGYLDIQSTPIIRMSDYQYLLVPYVLTTSNLIRNVIVKERKNASQKTNSNGEIYGFFGFGFFITVATPTS